MQSARSSILNSLKSAQKEPVQPRPAMPPLAEMKFDKEALIERFSAELAAQAGVMRRASDMADLRRILSEISKAEGIKSMIVSINDTVKSLGLLEWGTSNCIQVFLAETLLDREKLKEKAFSVDAGLTGAAFAVAESGTIGIAVNRDMPRLASIAPPIHIAVIHAERLFPAYETAIESIKTIPSQLILITGPSSTADIQATPFKGMHGPEKLFVILVE